MPTCPHCRRHFAPTGAEPATAPARCPFCHRDFAAGDSTAIHTGACSHCGAALTPLEDARGKVCSRERCRQEQLGAEAAARRTADAEFTGSMKARGEAFLRGQHDLPQDIPLALAIVPVNTRRIVPLPKERKQAFLAHLRAVVVTEHDLREVADGELVTSFSVPAAAEPAPTESQDKTLGLACAVCRGHCCRQGVEHAFQDPPSMRRVRTDFPGWTDDELIEQYADRLPAVSYEESCGFHTETGCNLPRDMRSDMCNRWMCRGQHRWLQELPAEGPSLTYVVATPDYEPQAIRSALVSAGHGGRADPVVRGDLSNE